VPNRPPRAGYSGLPIPLSMPIRSCLLVLLALLVTAPAALAQSPSRPEAPAVRPGAPGEAPRDAAETALPAPPPHTEADVRFMQDMIHHHAQALQMAELVPERTEREDLRRLALRIHTSQADEIAMMQRWLRERGEEAPDPDADDHAGHHGHHGHAHHGHGDHGEMPGMLTPRQMARLAAASGRAFDRLFLQAMIFHHEGALTMVEDLFAAEGAGQDADVFAFASHVDADQRAEIIRMRRLLDSLSQPDTE